MASYQNLSFTERERIAYASNDIAWLSTFGPAVDLEEQVSLHDSEIDNLEKAAYAKGYADGFGTDHVKTIAIAERDLAKAQENAETSRRLVCSMLDLFGTDLMKTVAGRKEIHRQLQAKLIKLGY